MTTSPAPPVSAVRSTLPPRSARAASALTAPPALPQYGDRDLVGEPYQVDLRQHRQHPDSPTLADRTPVFQLSGQAGPAASSITGVLVANNGAIVGGEQDVADFGIDSNDDLVPFNQFSRIPGGSYVTTPMGICRSASTLPITARKP